MFDLFSVLDVLCLSFKEKTPPVLTVLASTLTTLIENSY